MCIRDSPTDKDAAKKAYANAQYSQVMTLDKFCYHIASHGCVYSRADIQVATITGKSEKNVGKILKIFYIDNMFTKCYIPCIR